MFVETPTAPRTQCHENDARAMYGVSTMGSTFCFYKYDKDHPELGIMLSLRADQVHGRDTTPLEWWNHELFDAEGEVGERKARIRSDTRGCGRSHRCVWTFYMIFYRDSILCRTPYTCEY